jgi:aerobic carbon-monoxide dehydrogenase medium subunit
MNLGLSSPAYLIDITRIPALSHTTLSSENSVRIGALTTHREIEQSPVLRKHGLQIIAEAAGHIGDVQIRGRGTIGGSLCHSDPAGNYAPVAVALEAKMKIVGPKRERVVSVDAFFQGAFETAVEPNEILTEIEVPIPNKGTKGAFLQFGHVTGGFAIVSVCTLCRLEHGACKHARLGLAGAEAIPLRLVEAEKYLLDKRPTEVVIEEAAQLAVAAVTEPLVDIRANAEYRLHLVRVFVTRALQAVFGGVVP